MGFKLKVAVMLLLATAVPSVASVGAQPSSEAPATTEAPPPTTLAEAPPTTSVEPPVVTPPTEVTPPPTDTPAPSGSATESTPATEFDPNDGCLAPPGFCTRFLTILVNATPDTAEEFTFRIKEFDRFNGALRSIENVVARETDEAFVPIGNDSRYTVEYASASGPYSEVTDVLCDGPNQVVSRSNRVDIAPIPLLDDRRGIETIDCGFSVRNPPSIRIRQVTASPSTNRPAFSYTTTGSGLSAFSLDNDLLSSDRNLRSDTRTFNGLARGRRTFTATPRTGFRLTDIACTGASALSVDLTAGTASFFLFDGQDVVCTFTQTALGSVFLTLDARPESPEDFEFDTSDIGPAITVLDDDGGSGDAVRPRNVRFTGLLPGQVQIRQNNLPPGFDLRSLTCNRPVDSAVLGTRTVSFFLDPGENIACEFRNDRRGTITIVEDSLPDGPRDYPYTTNNVDGAPATFSLDDDPGDATLAPNLSILSLPAGGVHIITQAIPGGTPPWRLLDITCTTTERRDLVARSVTITVDPGENVTCTFRNAQFRPDALVAAEPNGPFTGDNIRDPQPAPAPTAPPQTVQKTVNAPNRTATITVKVQNDSGTTDDLVLRTAESGAGLFTIQYLAATTDITAQIRSAAGFTFPAVAEGGERTITVVFRSQADSRPNTGRNADITLSSGTAPAATDLVRARTVHTP